MSNSAPGKVYHVIAGKKTEFKISASHDGKSARVFTVKVLADNSVTVHSSWKGFQVRRQTPEGVVIEGSDNLVDAPHATFHPPHHYHLRADGMPMVASGLMWAHPNHAEWATPWLQIVSPPLQTMSFVSSSKASTKRNVYWQLPVDDISASLALIVDFTREDRIYKDPDWPTSKYVLFSDKVIRLRGSAIAGTQASIAFVAET